MDNLLTSDECVFSLAERIAQMVRLEDAKMVPYLQDVKTVNVVTARSNYAVRITFHDEANARNRAFYDGMMRGAIEIGKWLSR